MTYFDQSNPSRCGHASHFGFRSFISILSDLGCATGSTYFIYNVDNASRSRSKTRGTLKDGRVTIQTKRCDIRGLVKSHHIIQRNGDRCGYRRHYWNLCEGPIMSSHYQNKKVTYRAIHGHISRRSRR